MVVIVLVALALRTPEPPPIDPSVAERGDQSAEEFEAERQAKEAERAESELVRVQMPADRPLRVFYAADSLGAGFYSTEREGGYRYRINNYLSTFGEVEEFVGTKDAEDPLFQIVTLNGAPEEPMDLAVIELGTNDAGRTDLAMFESTYRGLLDELRAKAPEVKIICAGAWGLTGSKGTDPYDKVIDQVCREYQGVYVDLSELYAEPGNIGPEGRPTWVGPADAFHPNDAGHVKIAEILTAPMIVTPAA